MKALSIRQPWAWLIVNGYKDVENRTWPTNFRGRFLIHAGKHLDPAMEKIRRDIEARFHIKLPEDFERKGIVGEAELVDCVKKCPSAWFSGPYGFVLKNAKPLKFRPLPGRLSFFEVEL